MGKFLLPHRFRCRECGAFRKGSAACARCGNDAEAAFETKLGEGRLHGSSIRLKGAEYTVLKQADVLGTLT